MSGPALGRGVRLVHDPVRGQAAVLYPEGVLLLNDTAEQVVRRCDGTRTITEITADLALHFDGVTLSSVRELIGDLASRHLLTGADPAPRSHAVAPPAPHEGLPVGMIGELTYRCPLRCTYCANPVQLSAYAQELATEEWLALLRQARALGVLQLHLSGGEPLLHRDLPVLIAEATRLGIYTNLVTSGVPLSGQRLAALVDAGLDHIQLSLQDADATSADAIAGVRVHQRKLVAARQIKETGVPMTINVVLHAGNLDRLAAIGELALKLGADRLELAHTQFYGWAWRNRAALLPTEQQIDAAALAADALKDRVGGAVEIVHVRPDYHLGTPKPCMHGWGARQFAVAPNGDVLPCLAAAQLPDMDIPNVRRQPLAGIWRNSAAFTRFRGTAWLPGPCQSCALRDVDFGGCRCQAYQLTGDATATDPVCHLSPRHSEVTALVAAAAPGMPRPVAVPRRWR